MILGDEGIHREVGQVFWDDVTAAVSDRFRKGDFTGGLVHGIAEAGRVLSRSTSPRSPAATPTSCPTTSTSGRSEPQRVSPYSPSCATSPRSKAASAWRLVRSRPTVATASVFPSRR